MEAEGEFEIIVLVAADGWERLDIGEEMDFEGVVKVEVVADVEVQ